MSVLAYGLCVEEENLHPGGIGEHLVDVKLQGRDGVHCGLKGRVSVEGERRIAECGCGCECETG